MKIYPEIIKKIRKGDIELNHFIALDEFGFERDYFELIKYDINGCREILPFHPKIVVNNYTKDEPIKFINQYTEKDYQDMFEENYEKFQFPPIEGKIPTSPFNMREKIKEVEKYYKENYRPLRWYEKLYKRIFTIKL